MLGTFPLQPLHRLSQQWILALAVGAESFLETSSVRTSTDLATEYISTVLATEYISTDLATEYISTDLPTEYISTDMATEYIS